MDTSTSNMSGMSNPASPTSRRAVGPFWRLNKHVPRYTGHVPGLKDTFGLRYGHASEAVLSAGNGVPPTDSLQTTYSPRMSIRKIATTRPLTSGPVMDGLMQPAYSVRVESFYPPTDLPPITPMSGTRTTHTTASSLNSTSGESQTHIQGSPVDANKYLQSLIASNFAPLRIKSGSPLRNVSNISFGDTYYYGGPHMFSTTYSESNARGLGHQYRPKPDAEIRFAARLMMCDKGDRLSYSTGSKQTFAA